MGKKITGKQMERFIRSHKDILHVKVLTRFKDDIYETKPVGFAKTDVLDCGFHALGAAGLRLTGSGEDSFFFYCDGVYEGFCCRNRYGCGIAAVKI